MSYDLTFIVRPEKSPPSVDALRAWFEARPHWSWSDDGATYSHDDTGTELQISIGGEPLAMSFCMAGNAAHPVIFEAIDEVRAFVDAWELDVLDPQVEGKDDIGQGPFHAERMRACWDFYNDHETKTRHLMMQRPIPPHVGAAKLERAFAWNRGRGALDEGDHLFVPKISFAEGPDNVATTFVAWVGGAGLLPVVDSILHPLRHVPFAVLDAALAGATRHEHPAPYYRIEGALAHAVDAAITAASETLEMPVIVPPGVVRTTEVLTPYLVDGGFATASAESLGMAAQMAHATGDARRAFKTARRALELEPTSYFGAMLGAINGFYIGEFEEALFCADALLRNRPGDKTAQIIRCGVLTDLARYDDAVAAADAALGRGPDAMVENMKGDALAAAGKTADANAAYERALVIIDAQLKEDASDGDVISRRAYALIGLGRAKEALATAKKALKLVSDPLLTLQTIGRAELALGKPKAAAAALEKIDRERRAVPLASFTLALAYAQLDRRSDAAAALTDARLSTHFRNRIAAEPLLKDL